jgi:DNA-binding transcriptional ArsR family regulator
VGELAVSLPVSRPAVSQHLRVLENAGLVTHRKNGTRHLYELDQTGVVALRTWVDGFWDEALARFKAAAERKGERS